MGDPLRSVLKGELLPAYHIGCIFLVLGNIQFVMEHQFWYYFFIVVRYTLTFAFGYWASMQGTASGVPKAENVAA
jgi:hypothetical protein